MNMGYNVLLFYIRLWISSDIIQRHYYLPRNIKYSNKYAYLSIDLIVQKYDVDRNNTKSLFPLTDLINHKFGVNLKKTVSVFLS